MFLAAGISLRCAAQEPQTALSLTAEQQSAISHLAQNVHEEIKKDCAGTGCEILVVNFALPSGDTCSACIFLADSLAKALSELPGAPNVITRASLSSFLDEERIPSRLLNQPQALAWVGHQLHASKLVFGTIWPEKEFLLLRARVLKDETFGKAPHLSKEMSVKAPLGNLAEGLTASEPFLPLSKTEASLKDAPRFDPKDMKHPTCFYSPNPPLTQAARDAKFGGAVLIEAIVTSQGTIIEPRIVRGLPFGLNQYSMETLKTWRCKPAIQNGAPVSVLIPFEVTFHLY